VSTYFPHVSSELMLLDMSTRACLAKGEMLYEKGNVMIYIRHLLETICTITVCKFR
jgi:hypothetical protein